jgi:hypothetical protein
LRNLSEGLKLAASCGLPPPQHTRSKLKASYTSKLKASYTSSQLKASYTSKLTPANTLVAQALIHY